MDTHPSDPDLPREEGERRDRGEARTQGNFPIVGIGASAGGLQALQQFLARVPHNSGMAYVVILHLSPDHESSAAAVLQQATAMPVVQVTETVAVAPNQVYVIPPNADLSMSDGTIELEDRSDRQERHAPIDLFFRTAAPTSRACWRRSCRA